MRLIRGQYVLTGERVLRQAAVLISNDTIEAVGSYEDLSKQYPQADVLGSDQHWIMPGLVNAHHHSNGVSNLLQGVDDDFLEPWLLNIIHSMRSQDPTKKTLYSIAMLLQLAQRFYQQGVVARVQPDGWFVQDIADTLQV